MKSRIFCFTATALFAALAIPAQLAAQNSQDQNNDKRHPRYKLVDFGTFGGPTSATNALSVVMNGEGTVTGLADTPTPDPFAPNCFFDCFVSHAFEWRDGVLIDRGSLPGGGSSFTNSINSHDQIVGFSQNGLIDPLTGIPEFVAAVWEHDRVIDLGTFGGGFSLATMNNNRQQVVGCAFNDVPDSFTPSGVLYGIGIGPQQLRAFRWQGKQLQDLGTLGGPDACAVWINDRGQIAGASFTNSIVNSDTGLPTLDPFLWGNGRMFDLGTLGGTVGLANVVNNRGQVVGLSNTVGDQTAHPFMWPAEDGKMRDLGTLGGSFGMAEAVNDAGEVVGSASDSGDSAIHAFFWKQGVMTDLGTVGGFDCSDAHSINSKGQVVGDSFSCATIPPPPTSDHAFLWQDGHMIDLNVFVPSGSGLQLTEAKFINDAGEIAVAGFLSNGDSHAVVLIPCGEGDEDCADADEGTAAATAAPRGSAPILNGGTLMISPQRSLTPSGTVAAWRAQMRRRFHFPALKEPGN